MCQLKVKPKLSGLFIYFIHTYPHTHNNSQIVIILFLLYFSLFYLFNIIAINSSFCIDFTPFVISPSPHSNDIMEPMTALVLAFQLLALFSIAGALLIYLICKVRDDTAEVAESQPGTVLVTSADTALGLQLCTHLANKGCRVFAGMRDAQDSLPAKLLNGWLKMREYNEEPVRGAIIPMQLDVTREDVLRETTSAMGAHMNAGERGIAAVINTSGSLFRGRVEVQEAQQWEHMLKTNILGSLRVAKAFLGFLRPTRGRLIYLGAGAGRGSGEGLVAFNASRAAVEKCVDELRKELQPYGVRVVALDTTGITAEALYRAPVPHSEY